MFCFEVAKRVGRIMEHKWKTERIKDRKDMNEQYINGSWQEDGVSPPRDSRPPRFFLSHAVKKNPRIIRLQGLSCLSPIFPCFIITRLEYFNSTSLLEFRKGKYRKSIVSFQSSSWMTISNIRRYLDKLLQNENISHDFQRDIFYSARPRSTLVTRNKAVKAPSFSSGRVETQQHSSVRMRESAMGVKIRQSYINTCAVPGNMGRNECIYAWKAVGRSRFMV